MPHSQSVAYTTKNMRHIRHTPTLEKTEILSYLHKIDWRRLTNVWLWFVYWRCDTGNNQMYIQRQFIERQCYQVCELEQQNTPVCCMSVCESVCLSQTHIVLGLKHNFFRQRRPQVKTIQIGQHKENMRW